MVSENVHSIAAQQVNVSKNLVLPNYTTTQRDALSGIKGEIIFNTTTNTLNFYNGSVWEAVNSA